MDIRREGAQIPHWALIVLHLTHRPVKGVDDPNAPDDPLLGPYNYLDSYTVLTPDHGQRARDSEDAVVNMLQALLPKMGVTINNKSTREFTWIAPRYVANMRIVLLKYPALDDA